MKLFLALFFACSSVAAAQSPQVPEKMQFADITLTIRDDARQEIQKDVDAYMRYPNSFNVKVERAKTYFPIIEKIFAEENVPDDFKYLVIQESALIADAVSVSNAVGFWQFKDFTAAEMGLRVDKEIDERLNIVSSSRAAARYLKKNNTFFNNWIYALQAYQMGAGGVMRSEKDSKSGRKQMDITGKTYWYVKKYLAHKIAYENAIKGDAAVQVITFQNKSAKKLADLAKEVKVDEAELKNFNKWAKTGSIPDDRTYTVLIPVKGTTSDIKYPDMPTQVPSRTAAGSPGVLAKSNIKINGIKAILAMEGETPIKLAQRANVDIGKFLAWNDITKDTRIIPGEYYLLGKKRARATASYHKTTEGDDLWKISQRYAVQLNKLKRYNRLRSGEDVKPGATIWLASTKPKDSDKQVEKVVEVEKSSTFSWEPETKEQVENTPSQPIVVPDNSVSTDDNSNAPAKEEVTLRDTIAVNNKVRVDSVKTLQVVEAKKLPEISGEVIPSQQVIIERPEQHIVKAGETLYAIAKSYNVTVMNLVDWNQLDLQQGIKPGQVLKLSDDQAIASSETPTAAIENIEHTVRPSDTVYSIARKYGITIKELMEWNNKKDFSLSVGEKLKIVKK